MEMVKKVPLTQGGPADAAVSRYPCSLPHGGLHMLMQVLPVSTPLATSPWLRKHASPEPQGLQIYGLFYNYF